VKKRKLRLLIVVAVVICMGLALVSVWSKHLSPLTPGQLFGVLRSNEISYVINTARDAARRSPTTIMATVDGTDHELPLPNGTTAFFEKHLICSDELAPYLERLPSYGYELEEQAGSMYIYRNEALGITMHIMSQQWYGSMSLFYFEIMS